MGGLAAVRTPIDWKVVDTLCGQKRDRAVRLLVLFADDCDSERRRVDAALEAHDPRTLGEAAHRLSGSARLVGADAVAGLASAIEQASRRNEHARVEALAHDLSSALLNVCQFIATLDQPSAEPSA